MNEHRKTTRLSWKKKVVLKKDNEFLDCKIAQISMKNALIALAKDFNFNVGDKVEIAIELTNNQQELLIQTTAVVKRIVSSNQIAVNFYSMDLDSYVTLKDVLVYNFGDDSIILNDLKTIFSSYRES